MWARARYLLLLAAAATAAAVAFLLLREGGGSDGPEDRGNGVGRSGPGGDGAPADRLSPPREPGGQAHAGLPVPEGPRLHLRAMVGGEWPLPGVQVLAVERFRDGSLIAVIGDDAPEGGETDADGRITIRYGAEPRERLLGIRHEDAPFQEAENAEPAGEIPPFLVLRAGRGKEVTLRFRDPEGLAFLRPVDAATGVALAGREGIRFAGRLAGEDVDSFTDAGETSPGWLPFDGWDVADLRLLVPGYLPSPAPAGGWTGRTVLRLEADAAAFRGRVVGEDGMVVQARLISAVDGSECEADTLAGLPGRTGPFALSGVPSGEWDLVVRAWKGTANPDRTLWATVRIEGVKVGADLGELALLPGAVVRARLVDRDGTADGSTPLHIARALPGGLPFLYYGRDRAPYSVAVTWPGTNGMEESREKEPGEDGWAEFRGLRPGGIYVVATGRVPGLTRVVKAPSRPGEAVVAELDGGAPATTCVLRFTVDGKEPMFWQGMGGPFFAGSFRTGDGTLEAEIPPGRYRFRGLATMEEAGGRLPVYGEVEIPDTGRFEGTVDLRPRER